MSDHDKQYRKGGKFQHFLSQAQGAQPTHAQKNDDPTINFSDIDYEHLKYAALEKLEFPVSEAFYQWHLKAVDRQLVELRSQAQVDEQQIAALEQQKIRRERGGEPLINFNQAYLALAVADNHYERARLYEEIVGKGNLYPDEDHRAASKLKIVDGQIQVDWDAKSPLEEELSARFDEMWQALDAFDAREAGKPLEHVEDEEVMRLPDRNPRLAEYEHFVSDENHTQYFDDFSRVLSLIDNIFCYNDLHAEAIRPWDQTELDKTRELLERMLYYPESPVKIVEGDWQAKDIARRYVEAAQQAREQMLGKSR